MSELDLCFVLDDIADMMEILGENQYKIRAYRNASRALYRRDGEIESLWRQGKLLEVPGVGEAIAAKLDEYFRTGKISYHEELCSRVPPGVKEMLSIPGLGPKTVATIYKHTGIDNLQDLVKAAEEKRLRELPGLGAKTEYNIRKGVEIMSGVSGKVTLGLALPFAEELAEYLRYDKSVKAVEIVGSLRRGKPMVSDIDILVAADDEEAVKSRIRSYRRVKEIEKDEDQVIGGRLVLGLPFEVIIVPPRDYNRALVWCTGSKAHRSQLVEQGIPVDKMGSYESEVAVYESAGLCFIPPELREGRGEIEAAKKNQIPCLIELEDLKGDLHVHTDWSDGAHSLDEVLDTAKRIGYEYIAITDHSKSLTISRGLTLERLEMQRKAVEGASEKKGIRVLKGTEVDILRDGSLDFEDEILASLDVVVASIHSHFKLDKQAQTQRVEAAMKNPNVDIIGHLTGRLLGRRPGYEVDTDYLLKLAADTGTALEINSHPDRLDISEELARQCLDLGAVVAVNSDAHQAPDLELTRYGIKTARRGWLTADNVINAWPWERLKAWLDDEKGKR